MVLTYCVYVLFSLKDRYLYIGYSSNLEKRLSRHQSGSVKSTAPRRPLDLIFCEHYLFKDDAMKREKYFKTSMGKKAIKLMLSDTLRKIGYKGKLGARDIRIGFDE